MEYFNKLIICQLWYLIELAELHKSFSQKQYSLCRRFAVLISWQPFFVFIPIELNAEISFCETHFLIVGVTFSFIFKYLIRKQNHKYKTWKITICFIYFHLCSCLDFFKSFQTFSITCLVLVFSEIKIFHTLFRIIVVAPPTPQIAVVIWGGRRGWG